MSVFGALCWAAEYLQLQKSRDVSNVMSEIPVTIISGYLGAGKTTLVNHLLRNPNGLRLAILVNEFGDLAIDADLVEAQNDQMISISGGCVCCSYASGLIDAFLNINSLDPVPDQIVLEASGVAIPSAIADSLSLIDQIKLDSIICIVDASQITDQISNRYLEDTIARQIKNADLLVVNKCDLITPKALGSVKKRLRQMADDAIMIETEFASAASEIILQPFDRSTKKTGKTPLSHASNYKTKVIVPKGPVDLDQYVETLFSDHPDMIRAKGFVTNAENRMKTIQVVGRRTEISDAPAHVEAGIVIISLDVEGSS